MRLRKHGRAIGSLHTRQSKTECASSSSINKYPTRQQAMLTTSIVPKASADRLLSHTGSDMGRVIAATFIPKASNVLQGALFSYVCVHSVSIPQLSDHRDVAGSSILYSLGAHNFIAIYCALSFEPRFLFPLLRWTQPLNLSRLWTQV